MSNVMKEFVKVISNGEVIANDEVSESVKSGAYNTTNWHRYSEMIQKEIKQQKDVTFMIDTMSRVTFKWREWYLSGVESIHIHVMLVVKQRYSHLITDLSAFLAAPFMH